MPVQCPAMKSEQPDQSRPTSQHVPIDVKIMRLCRLTHAIGRGRLSFKGRPKVAMHHAPDVDRIHAVTTEIRSSLIGLKMNAEGFHARRRCCPVMDPAIL